MELTNFNHMLGTSENPHCLRGVNRETLPVEYDYNTKGWMTSKKFEDWLLRWDSKLNRKIALLLDNCSSHNISKEFSNIEIIKLPKNSTAISQPLDQGVIKVKTRYRSKLVKWTLDMLELEGEMKIDLKTAMIYFKQAWTEITPITITNCFKRAAVIVPQTENTL